MKNNSINLRSTTFHLLRRMAVVGIIGLVFLSVIWTNLSTATAAGDVGYKDFYYSSASAPTGQKPQSKLWYNDGLWWGVLYNRSAARFEIYRFDWTAQSWSTTGTQVDLRHRSSADALWTGTQLYVAANMTPGVTGDQNVYLTRYSYDLSTKTYSIDTGFPIVLWSRAVEAVVIDRDTTGTIWATFTDVNTSGGRNAYVTHSTANDTAWVTPYVLPATGASNLKSDDISTMVAYNGKIGVLWSNQNDNSVYFASHVDGLPDDVWALNPALQGPKYTDDHINIKGLQADSAGQVYAAVKTSLNDVNSASSTLPEILLLTLDNNGAWSRRTVARIVDNHTRPIVLIDNQNRQVFVFMTYQYPTQTSGAIYYKQASLDNASMQFPDGLGTPFMLFAGDTHINNASSTKQTLNSTTDLLVIAGDDNSRYYFHNVIDLGPGAPTATPTSTPTSTPTLEPSATATPTDTSTPTLIPSPTDTPTATPTPTPTLAPVTLFSDDFESGTFSNWTQVVATGDGTVEVQSTTVAYGIYAAHLAESSTASSVAYARRDLGENALSLTVSGDFMVTAEGARSGNVPILRMFDANGVRVFNLYRVNQKSARIDIQHTGKYYQTSGSLPLGAWSRIEAHVTLNGNSQGVISIFQDGKLIYQTNAADLGTAGIRVIQIGNETTKQAFEMYVDNILAIR
jgi:hypothetical protein